jgi:transposase
MPKDTLANFILLPELKLIRSVRESVTVGRMECFKVRKTEYCHRCAKPSDSTYDHRTVRVKDAPIRGRLIYLSIRKRRLWCFTCKKPFTESTPGVRKSKRHTERYARDLMWACENFSDLSQVRRAYRCSSDFLYRSYYKKLSEKVHEKINYPWTKTIGIDEHAFKKATFGSGTQFVTMIVDYDNKRVRELCEGKTGAGLSEQLKYIPGRENVKNVVLDLCDPFKNFAKEYFPNSRIIADKFHVLRLLSPHLMRRRKEITGTRADLKAKRLLLMSIKKLGYFERHALREFLFKYPELNEVYYWKEKLHRFYRTKGYHNAAKAIRNMIDNMAFSLLPEIKTLRRTLIKWKEEILNYFLTGITNARTEGFNNKAKVVKRRAYGYKSFRNYRLKVLTACA